MKWVAILIGGILGLVVIAGIGILALNSGMSEVKALVINPVDLSTLPDGTYTGAYSQGRWSYELEARIAQGRIESIRVLGDHGSPKPFNQEIIGKILSEQTLGIDMIAGATVNSKAFLKALETALLAR